MIQYVSTKVVVTVDLAWVHRCLLCRHSVVRDFTVTIFYLELYIYRLCLALEHLAWEYFWPHSEKTRWSPEPNSGFVIAIILHFLGEIKYHFEKQDGCHSCYLIFFLIFPRPLTLALF